MAFSGVSISLVSAESPETKQLWAVVVGVEGGGAVHLDNDAMDFANVLTSTYGYPSSNIKLLINSEATKSAVISALEWIRDQESKPDAVCLFFSVHGSSDCIYLYDDSLHDYELSTILLEFESHNILVVLSAPKRYLLSQLTTRPTGTEATNDIVNVSQSIDVSA